MRAAIHLPGGGDGGLGQAVGCHSVGAQQGLRVECAGGRVGDQAILDAIRRIAGGDDGGVPDGQLRRCQIEVGAVGLVDFGVPAMVTAVLCEEVPCGSFGGDAVEIGRVMLRLHQRLAPDIGTAAEIGVDGGLAIIGFDQTFGDQGGCMHAAMGEIDANLHVGRLPRSILPVVAHVGGGRGDGPVSFGGAVALGAVDAGPATQALQPVCR